MKEKEKEKKGSFAKWNEKKKKKELISCGKWNARKIKNERKEVSGIWKRKWKRKVQMKKNNTNKKRNK